MTLPVPRLAANSSLVLVVDVQDKLLAKLPGAERLVRNVEFLLDVATQLSVPTRGTEQYPRGLGPTRSSILNRLPKPLPSKTSFSCHGCEPFVSELATLQPAAVVLVGMETHVCIAQTALDLLDRGLSVFLPVDGLGSRFEVDHEVALRRMERAGAVPTTVEAVAFEWLRDASHPQFKAVSRLVVERSTES